MTHSFDPSSNFLMMEFKLEKIKTATKIEIVVLIVFQEYRLVVMLEVCRYTFKYVHAHAHMGRTTAEKESQIKRERESERGRER